MDKRNIKVGTIVVIQEGDTFGQTADTITKVVSKPGALTDPLFKLLGIRYHPEISPINRLVLCEDMRSTKESSRKRFRNLPVTYERISDLRPATEIEKKMYRSLKKRLS